jgi:hypothetical protein
MKRLIQFVIVIASTGIGIAFGRYALVPALMAIVPHMAWLLPQSGPPKHDLGDLASFGLTIGYSFGLSIGIGMTLAIFGGLLIGIALARRVTMPAQIPTLKTV